MLFGRFLKGPKTEPRHRKALAKRLAPSVAQPLPHSALDERLSRPI